MERLQKYLAAAGVASRRQSKELIRQGRVTVNGKIAVLGTKVLPGRDMVEVDGKEVRRAEKVYIMLNKPLGVITSCQDPRGRTTVMDLLTGITAVVHPVGRLDYDSEGLLLLTNDGDLTYRLTHPSYQVKKTYQVVIGGVPTPGDIKRISKGILLDDGWTAPAGIQVLGPQTGGTLLELTIHEGRNRQVRRMWAKLGHSVIRLRRVKFGPLTLGQLEPGEFRPLDCREVERLWMVFKGRTDAPDPVFPPKGR